MLQQVTSSFRALWAFVLASFAIFKKAHPASPRFELPASASDHTPVGVGQGEVPDTPTPAHFQEASVLVRALRADTVTGGSFNVLDVDTVIGPLVAAIIEEVDDDEEAAADGVNVADLTRTETKSMVYVHQLDTIQEDDEEDDHADDQTHFEVQDVSLPTPPIYRPLSPIEEVEGEEDENDSYLDQSLDDIEDFIIESPTKQTLKWNMLMQRCSKLGEEDQSQAPWPLVFTGTPTRKVQGFEESTSTANPSMVTSPPCVSKATYPPQTPIPIYKSNECEFGFDTMDHATTAEEGVEGIGKSGHCPSISASSSSLSESSVDSPIVSTPSMDLERFTTFKFPIVAISDPYGFPGDTSSTALVASVSDTFYGEDQYDPPFTVVNEGSYKSRECSSSTLSDAVQSEEAPCSPTIISSFTFNGLGIIVDDSASSILSPSVGFQDEHSSPNGHPIQPKETTMDDIPTSDCLFKGIPTAISLWFDSLFTDDIDISSSEILTDDLCGVTKTAMGVIRTADCLFTAVASVTSFDALLSTADDIPTQKHSHPAPATYPSVDPHTASMIPQLVHVRATSEHLAMVALQWANSGRAPLPGGSDWMASDMV